jgi:glycosyltransferase involved in cell wall biosynthesis
MNSLRSKNSSDFLFSVIIANHNYEAYLRQAIDSALAVDWPSIEVIVVDDGSTDGSHEIIEAYGSRISAVCLPKSSQLDARNHGFGISRGDIISFLDSDDLLDPSIMRRLMSVWNGQVSKVQVQMGTVDANGNNLRSDFPRYEFVPTADDCRRWSLDTSSYPTPPGSGNIYARWFLERIFPLDHSCGDATDSCCVTAAPLIGNVITIPEVLAFYRVHGNNLGAISELQPGRLHRQIIRALQRFEYLKRVALTAGLTVSAQGPHFSLHYLMYRAASFRVSPLDHPISGDSKYLIVRDAYAAAFKQQGFSIPSRALIFVWICCVLWAPYATASWLMRIRFDSQYRAMQKSKWKKVITFRILEVTR